MHKIIGVLATVLVLGLAGCGDGDRTSQAGAFPTPITVECKQSIGNTTTITVSTDCGDDVVFAPEPTIVEQPAPVVVQTK